LKEAKKYEFELRLRRLTGKNKGVMIEREKSIICRDMIIFEENTKESMDKILK
jgi:hypothetical protein